MTNDRDYVLGTHDEEIERLGLQHRVWPPQVLDAWKRAGITLGQTVLDVGCGPGHATLDLAEIVGPRGKVVAVDRSRRFLDALEAARRARGLGRIETHEQDLDLADLPAADADAAWSRWVIAFVRDPRALVGRIARSLRPGGRTSASICRPGCARRGSRSARCVPPWTSSAPRRSSGSGRGRSWTSACGGSPISGG